MASDQFSEKQASTKKADLRRIHRFPEHPFRSFPFSRLGEDGLCRDSSPKRGGGSVRILGDRALGVAEKESAWANLDKNTSAG